MADKDKPQRSGDGKFTTPQRETNPKEWGNPNGPGYQGSKSTDRNTSGIGTN